MMNEMLTNKRKRSCLANTARLSYVWSANRQRITHEVQLEFMQLSQIEVADAYASDVTRLLSFREYGCGLSMFTDRPRGFEDLLDLQDESSLHLLGSSELPSLSLFRFLHLFHVAAVNWFSRWDTAFSLTTARQFYRRFCKKWQ